MKSKEQEFVMVPRHEWDLIEARLSARQLVTLMVGALSGATMMILVWAASGC